MRFQYITPFTTYFMKFAHVGKRKDKRLKLLKLRRIHKNGNKLGMSVN